MSIPTFSNGDSMGDVRLFSLNPAITEVNRLTSLTLTMDGEMDVFEGRFVTINNSIASITADVTALQGSTSVTQGQVDSLATRLAEVEADIADIYAKGVVWTNLTVRTKAEASWTTPIVIPTGAVNLISLLKAVTPTSGSLTSPLLDLVNNKITPLNKNKTMMIKLSMAGTYGSGGASADKAILLSLTGGVTDAVSDFKGGGLFTAENAVITLISMISVDENGNATTLGITPTIQSFVRTFTTTRVLLVIDQ